MPKYFPPSYTPLMEQKQTERAIKFIKDTFERELSGGLRLSRVTSPRFVKAGAGINDDLNGVERPVRFEVGNLGNQEMEVVQSLAKWKRMALADHGYAPGTGIYTDMDAIRPDDVLDAIHSIYVDQWDWELTITEAERNLDFLKAVVRKIYSAMIRTEFLVSEMFPVCRPLLPKEITFIHTEDAQREYPQLAPEDRERVLAKRYGAIFLIGIGSPLADGKSHGGRAPDYDDWSTPSGNGYTGLNGDIVVWDSVRGDSMELSSMGIRVDRETLIRQLPSGAWRSGPHSTGTSGCWAGSYRSPSGEDSGRAGSACTCSRRPTSGRCRRRSGPPTYVKKRSAWEFSCYRGEP